jgi:hypothetical protein
MTFQIFAEIIPPLYETVKLFTAPGGSNLGVQGTLLMVNQANIDITDYNTNCDFVRVGISNSVVLSQDGYIMYDTLMPPNHMAQLQNINLPSGGSLFVYSQKSQTSFVFTGSTITV